MAIPKVYRSTDPGAPVLSSAGVNSAITVLRACLVGGYGDKSPAGWTDEFSATDKAVFRNAFDNGGTGCFVQVRAFNTTGGAFELKAYSSMTDVDTGINPTKSAKGWRNISGSADQNKWVIIATDTAFWFSAEAGGLSMLCGAGDVISFSDGDVYRYFVAGDNTFSVYNYYISPWLGNYESSNGGSGSWNTNSTAEASGLSLGRSHTGLGSAINAGIMKPYYGNSGRQWIGNSQNPRLPSPNAANAATMPAYVIYGNGPNAVIRGRLPGVLLPIFDMSGVDVGEVNVATAGPGSATVALCRRVNNNDYAGLLIETALDWD